MRGAARSAMDVIGLIATLIIISIAIVIVVIVFAGVLTARKGEDLAKVMSGRLATPIEAVTPVETTVATPLEIKTQEELRGAVEEWNRDREAQVEEIAAQKDALNSMRRELETVKSELDAQHRDLQARIKAFEEAKTAEEAAAGDAAFVEAVKTYGLMDAKVVAELLYGYGDREAVRYLRAFKTNFRAEVLTEIKKIDDTNPMGLTRGSVNRAAKLQEILSGGAVDMAAPATTAVAN